MADDILKDALEAFKAASDAEKDNRAAALDDLRFSRLAEQWPEDVKAQRETEGRPCLTINKLPAFIRQVVNDARQNSPSIKVHPADSTADPQTAEIINGLIRNIEYTSDADVAYDTGIDNAVTMGFGFWRVNVDYAHDDTFDKDLVIQAVPNPFAIYGDPYSTKADSSDWNSAFVIDLLSKDQFKRKYRGADTKQSWAVEYNELEAPWGGDDNVMIAEYWTRSEVARPIVLLSDGTVMDAERYKAEQEMFTMLGLSVVGDRETRGYKVKQRIMTGAEVLETNDWAGRYIPIIPIYGEIVNVEGARHLRSLVRDAKDPQRMFNYWRTTSTELVALAPKAPYIGPAGAFTTDAEKWATANVKSHSHLEYDGPVPPQRQPFSGVPAGALQEALNASDDIKAIIGIYDAALGARSNETSGKAILARQRESDTSTFHYIDNRNTAIRHTGRILIDLIPHVYNGPRVVRVLGGSDKKTPENVQINQPIQLEDGTERIYDLTAGKYDLTITTGPSYSTQREETAAQITEIIRALPQSAPLLLDILAKNQDWPEADEVERRMKAMLPPQIKGQDPQVQQLQQQLQQMQQQAGQAIAQLQQQLQQLQADKAIEAQKLQIDGYNAETNRLKVAQSAMSPQDVQALVMQTLAQALGSLDPAPNVPNQQAPPMAMP